MYFPPLLKFELPAFYRSGAWNGSVCQFIIHRATPGTLKWTIWVSCVVDGYTTWHIAIELAGYTGNQDICPAYLAPEKNAASAIFTYQREVPS